MESHPQLNELSVLELRGELKRWEKRHNALVAAFPYLEDGSASITAQYVRGGVWDEYDLVMSQIQKIKLELYKNDDAPNLPTPTCVLTKHEKQISDVIRRGAKGMQYCRELDHAGVRPRRTGSWRGCPGTYSAAYQAGKPWRHRIQDEKSKIRRKAKLANTRNSLAGE